MPYIRMDQIEGYYTINQIAERLDINRNTLQSRVTRGVFPPPTHTVPGGRRLYYSQEEMNNFLLAAGKEVE